MRKELIRAVLGFGVFVTLIAIVILKEHFIPTESVEVVTADFLGDELLPPRRAPDFDLVDRTGKRMELKDLRGRAVLLSFAYTNCATVCPLMFQSYLGVQKELGDRLGKDVDLVFITLDPDLDTPERLQEATQYVGGHWHFLTEDEESLEQTWRAYNVVREKNKGVVDHSSNTYLIDGTGLMRVRYFGTPQSKVLVNDIEALLGSS